MVHLSQKHEGPASRRGLSCVHRYAKAGDRGGGPFLPPDRAMPARWAGAGRQAVRDVGLSLCRRSSCGGRRLVHCVGVVVVPVVVTGAEESLQGRMRGSLSSCRGPSPCGVACLSLSLVPIVRPDVPNPSNDLACLTEGRRRFAWPRSQDRNGRRGLSSPGRCAPIPRENEASPWPPSTAWWPFGCGPIASG